MANSQWIDSWDEEHLRLISDSVLQRGVERFGEALRHLGASRSKHVEQIRRGLRLMQRELARRSLAREPLSGGGDGATRPLADGSHATIPSAGITPRPANHDPKLDSEKEDALGGTPVSGDVEKSSSTGARGHAEPIWRLIPYLRGSSSKIVSIIDGDGVVRYQSNPVKWLLGFDADALVGTPLEAALRASSREQARSALERMAAGQVKFDTWRFEFYTASGGSFWLEGMASNFLRDARLGGILVYWREWIE